MQFTLCTSILVFGIQSDIGGLTTEDAKSKQIIHFKVVVRTADLDNLSRWRPM